MWELDYKESWVLKNWCFWTVVLEKTLESPLDCKEIQPVIRKGNQSWIFIGRTDAKLETPILWPHDVKNWLIGKDPDAKKDWRQEKGMTEDEMVGWHHQLNGHWVWVNSGSWWWTGKPGMLQSMGLQRVGHDWATELNWMDMWMDGWMNEWMDRWVEGWMEPSYFPQLLTCSSMVGGRSTQHCRWGHSPHTLESTPSTKKVGPVWSEVSSGASTGTGSAFLHLFE